MRDVVDLEVAIAAAADAIRVQHGDLVYQGVIEAVARTAVEAAAGPLGLVDIRSISDSRIRAPRSQSVVHALWPRGGSEAACGASWPFTRQPDSSPAFAHTTCMRCMDRLALEGVIPARRGRIATVQTKGDLL